MTSIKNSKLKFNSTSNNTQALASERKAVIFFTPEGDIILNGMRYTKSKEPVKIGSADTDYRQNDGSVVLPAYPTKTSLGLDNVTNESKATMLADAALTGTPTAPTAAQGTNTTQIATTAFVKAEIDAVLEANDAMKYKGVQAGGNTGAYGALTPAANAGWSYKVSAAGMINGAKVEVGDMLICMVDDTPAATDQNYATIIQNWNIIQRNEDGTVSGPESSADGDIVLFDGATGKTVKSSRKKVSDFAMKLEVADVESLTSEQCEALKCGDVVVKSDASGKHAYVVSFKNATGMCLTYADAENIETVAYDKANNAWTKTDKTIATVGDIAELKECLTWE